MAYRKNSNLRDSLVHTALDKKRSGDDPWLLNRTPFIFNGFSGRGHPIREIITSQVKNVILYNIVSLFMWGRQGAMAMTWNRST